MEYFALTSLSELSVLLGAVFAAFGTILVGFYKYAQAREKDFEKSREAQTVAFTNALDNLGKKIEADSRVGQELVKETRKGNQEAEARNGHLAEITVQARDQVIDVIQTLKTQNVNEQVVEHQVIKEKE